MADHPESMEGALAVARPVIEQVVWCTMATVGPDGAPRTRIVHPIWDWDRGVGWITSRGTPLRRRHLAHHPGASLLYWSPAQDIATLDCAAHWVPREERAAVWDACSAPAEPMGFDPSTMFGSGPDDPGFAPIEVVPHRIRVATVAALTAGQPPTLWSRRQPSRTAGEVPTS
jgi:hypothetical protein